VPISSLKNGCCRNIEPGRFPGSTLSTYNSVKSSPNPFVAAFLQAAFTIAVFLVSQRASCDEPRFRSDLPFAGTDTISVLNERGKQQVLGGRIEDISAETLTLRRSGRANIELFRMSDITELSFAKTSAWETGLRHQLNAEHRQALEYFDKALKTEDRLWAWNELQASAAKTCIALGDRLAAVQRIEEIFDRDRQTHHVWILPLVWDARLPETERIESPAADLNSASVIRQLVAASALLDNPTYRVSAEAKLERLRRGVASKRITELAEAQLWRLYLLDPSEKRPLLAQWQDRVSQLPVNARSGPQFVVGRLLAKQHQYDSAALAFLWMPLVSSVDPALSAQSLSEGISCLQLAGRYNEAKVLLAELQQRYPQTSAARIRQAADTLDASTRVEPN